jgi:two-component system chemotaxis response regulator CheB
MRRVTSTIRVLIVDDSAVYREFLSHLLRSDPRIEIAGAVRDGAAALQAVISLRPDVITMDINLPGMNGYDVTRRIMESFPTPIVVVSAAEDAGEVEMSFRAMESGAVAVVPKPRGGVSPDSDAQSRELIQTVALMAEVKVVRRWSRKQDPQATGGSVPAAPGPSPSRPKQERRDVSSGCEAVLIGGSTGAPVPLRTILSALPPGFPAVVLVVQHIAAGFGAGFAEWLAGASVLPVHVAREGELVLPGHVYIAPDEVHMGVCTGRRIMLGHGEPENGLRPSISHLFRSAAKVYGKNVVGILLSGMGRDGAEELRALRVMGAVTFAQDRESSVVFGMPSEAVKLDGATYIMPPESIAAAVASMAEPGDRRRTQ